MLRNKSSMVKIISTDMYYNVCVHACGTFIIHVRMWQMVGKHSQPSATSCLEWASSLGNIQIVLPIIYTKDQLFPSISIFIAIQLSKN